MTSAPGGTPLPPALSAEQAAALAKAHGLEALGGRPPFGTYVRTLWRRRSFLWTLASADAAEKNSEDRLGVIWTLLNPLLLVVSYFLIFGLLLDTKRGVQNFIGFLSIGVVVFGFSSAAITKGTKAIVGNLGLVRALRFPRALLPLSVTLSEAIRTLPAMAVLIVLMLVTHEPVGLKWLLLPLAFALQIAMMAGLVLMGARLLNISRDIGNLIPVAIRLLRYLSGVFFSIDHYARHHETVRDVLNLQPFALPITLVRQSLMTEFPIVWPFWAAAGLWAVGLLVAGLWLFWRDEAKYGRA